MTRWLRLLLCIVLLLPLIGCDSDDNDGRSSGKLVSVEHLGDVSPGTIPQLLAIAGVQLNLELNYSVGVYRIEYTTRNPDGDIVEVSGAMFVPIGAPAVPFACAQHGTQTLRHNVASTTPLIYGADALMLAAEGYVACSPDYIGYGSSTDPHPYLHADTSAGTVLDAIRAGRRFCEQRDIELDGQLFLVGYSQGGYVTLAAQRAIEEGANVGLTLAAVASLSGAYDLTGIVDIMLANPNDDDVVLAALFVTSYNHVYGWGRLSEIFRTPYDARVTWLFDGTRSFPPLKRNLPRPLDKCWIPVLSAVICAAMSRRCVGRLPRTRCWIGRRGRRYASSMVVPTQRYPTSTRSLHSTRSPNEAPRTFSSLR